MNAEPRDPARIGQADIPLERDVLERPLLRELSGTLQDVVGQRPGDPIECRVVVYPEPTPESDAAPRGEYFSFESAPT